MSAILSRPQTDNKNSKVPRYCPFVRRNHIDRLFPAERDSNAENVLFDDVIMD